jgi:hypothetical protein
LIQALFLQLDLLVSAIDWDIHRLQLIWVIDESCS